MPISRVIHEGSAACSTLVALRDNRIGLLFERGDKGACEQITFATFTLEWLSDGKDRLASFAR